MEGPKAYYKLNTQGHIIEYIWNLRTDTYAQGAGRFMHFTRPEAIDVCVAWNRALKWHFKCNDTARRLHGVPVHEGDINALALIRQPPCSRCCGQCCVAMVAGMGREAATKAIGKKGATSTKVLQKGLKKLGVRHRSGRLRAIHGDLSKLPHTAILKITAPWRRSGWHWVLKHNRKIYDPARGVYQVKEYTDETYNIISSYLEIFTDGRPPGLAPGVNYIFIKNDRPAINAPEGARRFLVSPNATRPRH